MQENGLLDGVTLPATEDFAWQDLDCPYRGDLNRRFSYLFSMNGPTILLFRPKTDLREWIANPDHIQKEPESFNTLKYLHIPANWVLDIANFVSSTSTVAYTRIPSSMDVSPGIATSGGSGLAMRRKYEQEGKRFRWKDSNNTAEDFEKSPPSLKR